MSDRIASHPDDPNAPLADRLLLALGMWPKYVEELGAEEVIAATAQIRSDAHRLPMCSEDYGIMSQELQSLRADLILLVSRWEERTRDDSVAPSVATGIRDCVNDLEAFLDGDEVDSVD